MARWKKNEATARLRCVLLAVYDDDGALAPVTTTFTAAGECTVDPSNGVFVAKGGTLANAVESVVVADFVFTATNATETFNKVAHGLATGYGPMTASNSGGALPAGLVAATDYWVISTGADTFQLATSLANALAGTAQAITTDGTGTQTLSDTASTQRLVPGHWLYTASQAELNFDGSYFAVKIEKTGFRTVTAAVDMYVKEMETAAIGANTYGDLIRLLVAIEAGLVTDFTTDTNVYHDPFTGAVRWTETTDPTGRLAVTPGDLT